MKKNVLIIGAGAIGRGFLPWILPGEAYTLSFVDSDKKIIEAMRKAKTFDIYRTQKDDWQIKSVKVENAWLPEEFPGDYDNFSLVFVNVGPRNCLSSIKIINEIKVPVIVCENDPSCVQEIKDNTKIEKCYFAVPDVITSNKATEVFLQKDGLSVITEEGDLFFDEGVGQTDIIGYPVSSEELEKQWIAKLFLHNTPHCVAAYLGALCHFTYLHETMQYPALVKIVSGCMNEMLQALKCRWDIDHEFLNWYADKELKRFSNKLLYDPIARVAREPLRKLALDGRLVGAAQLCLSHGFLPEHMLFGIVGALLFNSTQDEDNHLQFMREHLSLDAFFSFIIGLRRGEALEIVMKSRLDQLLQELSKIVDEVRESAHED